jgi:hypothetical protein
VPALLQNASTSAVAHEVIPLLVHAEVEDEGREGAVFSSPSYDT